MIHENREKNIVIVVQIEPTMVEKDGVVTKCVTMFMAKSHSFRRSFTNGLDSLWLERYYMPKGVDESAINELPSPSIDERYVPGRVSELPTAVNIIPHSAGFDPMNVVLIQGEQLEDLFVGMIAYALDSNRVIAGHYMGGVRIRAKEIGIDMLTGEVAHET